MSHRSSLMPQYVIAMSHAYAAIFLHVVFSTREREALIPEEREGDLFAYIGGIAKNLGFRLLKIGGTADHVHLLISIPAKMPATIAIQKIKANSSRFLGDGFAWQEGYGVFTVSASQLETMTRYIAGQREHHRRHTFDQEFNALLQRYGLRRDLEADAVP